MKKLIPVILLSCLLAFSLVGNGFAATPRSGGTFVFCAPYGGDIFSLDMHRTTRTQDYIVGLNIFRSLYRWDASTNLPVLDLATKVETSDDGLTYTFSLRKDVFFHNGRPMTADDIIYSYERIMKPETASSAIIFIRNIKGAAAFQDGKATSIAGLKKIDAHTLSIELENAQDIGYLLYEIETAIVPREEIEAKGDAFGTNPVGCGPFRFVKWVKGSEIVLEKFDRYYEAGKPYVNRIVYKIMEEGSARDLAFRAKELDATLVGSSQYPIYKKDAEMASHMIEVAEMYTRVMGLNPAYKPLQDKRVRQAINLAIDRELIIKKLLKDKAYTASSFLPLTSPAFDENLQGYAYDPEKAAQLMAAAGYKDGFSMEVIGTNSEAYGVKVVEALIPFLKKINITVIPQQLEGAMLAERLTKGDYQAFIWSLESGPSPLTNLKRFHSTTPRSGSNYVSYNNAEFDKLLDQASSEADPAKKIGLLKQANAILMEDAPFWFFNYNKAVIAYQPWVHGIQSVATEMMYQDFTNLWIDAQSPRANQ